LFSQGGFLTLAQRSSHSNTLRPAVIGLIRSIVIIWSPCHDNPSAEINRIGSHAFTINAETQRLSSLLALESQQQ